MMKFGLLAALAAGAMAMAGQTVVPVEQEPHHRPVFDNGVVRMLDVNLPPGYVSLFHTHAIDNVSVRMTVGTIRTDLLTGNGTPQTSPAGRVAFYSASPPYVHRVVNTGAEPVRIFDVEILGAKSPPMAGVADDLDHHETIVDNARVRVYRITLAAGASLPAHTHPYGWLEVIVAGTGAGGYVWHEPGATAPAIAPATVPTDIVEIAPR